MEIKQNFSARFNEIVHKKLPSQISNFTESQLNLVSEFELFRWTALKEARDREDT